MFIYDPLFHATLLRQSSGREERYLRNRKIQSGDCLRRDLYDFVCVCVCAQMRVYVSVKFVLESVNVCVCVCVHDDICVSWQVVSWIL